MTNIKFFICKLIIVSILLQLTTSVVINSRYKGVMKLLSAIIIINVVFSFPIESLTNEIKNVTQNSKMVYNNNVTYIEDSFTDKVSTLIKNDIKEKYQINAKVEVNTDFERLYIWVELYNYTKSISEIKKYIEDKYCNINDEVKVNSVTN